MGASNRGATTAVTWVEMIDHPSSVLLYGTENGSLVVWAKSTLAEVRVPFLV